MDSFQVKDPLRSSNKHSPVLEILAVETMEDHAALPVMICSYLHLVVTFYLIIFTVYFSRTDMENFEPLDFVAMCNNYMYSCARQFVAT